MSLKNRFATMSTRKKAAIAVAALGVVAVVAGVGFALWSAVGSGSGRARSTTAVEVTVTASDGPEDLYPGFTAGDVYFTLTNTNPYPVTFTAATPGAITSSDPTNCPASNVTVVSASGLNLQVAANATSPQLSIADVVTMASAAPNGCQGVSFDIVLTLTGTQS